MDVPQCTPCSTCLGVLIVEVYTVVTLANIVNNREAVALLLHWTAFTGKWLPHRVTGYGAQEYTILNYHVGSTNSVSSLGCAPDISVAQKGPRRIPAPIGHMQVQFLFKVRYSLPFPLNTWLLAVQQNARQGLGNEVWISICRTQVSILLCKSLTVEVCTCHSLDLQRLILEVFIIHLRMHGELKGLNMQVQDLVLRS